MGDTAADQEGEKELDVNDKEYLRMIKTYILADKLQDNQTVDLIMDALVSFYDWSGLIPGASIISFVWNHDAKAIELVRRLIIDMYVRDAPTAAFEDLEEEDGVGVPPQFLYMVLKKKAELEMKHDLRKIGEVFTSEAITTNRCQYHRHDEEKCAWKSGRDR